MGKEITMDRTVVRVCALWYVYFCRCTDGKRSQFFDFLHFISFSHPILSFVPSRQVRQCWQSTACLSVHLSKPLCQHPPPPLSLPLSLVHPWLALLRDEFCHTLKKQTVGWKIYLNKLNLRKHTQGLNDNTTNNKIICVHNTLLAPHWWAYYHTISWDLKSQKQKILQIGYNWVQSTIPCKHLFPILRVRLTC